MAARDVVWTEVASCKGMCFVQLHWLQREGYQGLGPGEELEENKEEVGKSASFEGLKKEAWADIG